MTTNTTLSLIIPCFNEEATLANCINKVNMLQSDSLSLEIIIVDDKSTDNSLKIAYSLKETFKNIQVVSHSKNMGKGAALRNGFLHASGDFVGIQDADDEYNPLDYLKLLEPLLANKADVVFGSRYLKPESRRVLYFWHTWMNKALTLTTNMFTNLDITDMETCYKLFKREVIQKIAPDLRENRFGFEPEVTIHVSKGDYRVHECAISYNPRSYEEGKKIGWRDGVRALYCILHYGGSFAPLPMQIFMYLVIGGLCALLNFVIFILLLHFNIELFYSTTIAFTLAAVVNYFLCVSILFRHKARWTTLGEIIAYLFVIVIMGFLDYSVTMGMFTVGISYSASKASASVIGFIGNFLFRRFLVF